MQRFRSISEVERHSQFICFVLNPNLILIDFSKIKDCCKTMGLVTWYHLCCFWSSETDLKIGKTNGRQHQFSSFEGGNGMKKKVQVLSYN